MPPTPNKSSDANDEQSALEQAMGHAVLFGHLEVQPATGEYLLKGEWRHVQGPLHGGAFQMTLHENGIGCGWWEGGGGDEDRNPWEWNPELEPLTQVTGEEHVIQTGRGGLLAMRTMKSHLFERSASIRPSLSGRLDRSKTFFDELLESEGTSSVWIARWGVFCAWIFFFQTLIALTMGVLQVTEEYASIMQCAFQAVYTSTYMSFLLIYARMSTKPPLDYVLGVALYTVGYACFLGLYVVVLAVDDAEVVAQISGNLYLSGSLFFLVGSISLVHATFPPPITMVFRSLTWFQQARVRYSMIDQQSSLFWGSITFLIGSCSFCADAAWGLMDPESKPPWFSAASIVTGYFVFTIGRLYFLWGSTTSECNAFFFRKGAFHRWQQYVSEPMSGLLKWCPAQRRANRVAPIDSSGPSVPQGKKWLDLCEA